MNFGFAGRCFLDSFLGKLPPNSKYKVLTDYKEVKNYDTIVFTGGEDINPNLYGEEPKNVFYYNSHRDNLEISLLKEAIELNKVIIGVCRGHQLINAVLGGSLYQDIKSDLKIWHTGGELLWNIKLSILPTIYDDVNSLHHQAVKKLGNNFISIATAADGIIESTVCPEMKIVTFQFHPELLNETKEFFKLLSEGERLWNQ
jgi:putative glutamine amidotransferase